MDKAKDYFYKRLNFDNYMTKNMKIIKKIVNDDYFVQYGINVRNQLGMDLRRSKASVDISKLVPKEVKCVFFTRCEGLEMPKLPDTVEVLFIQNCSFRTFYFPKNLKELYFNASDKIKTLPDISNLKNLWSLDITNYLTLRFLPKNLPENLTMLTLSYNMLMKSSLTHLPKKLEYIYLENCQNIKVIPDLRYLKKLNQITLEYPYKFPLIIDPKTKTIPGLFIKIR
jgi:hypothetical protein